MNDTGHHVAVEVCIEGSSLVAARTSAANASAGGADRIELCRDMSAGGLTPAADVIAATRSAFGNRPGLLCMIRPRAADFVYSEAEVSTMETQVREAAGAGADGVVLGLLTLTQSSDSGPYVATIDVPNTRRLVEAARAHGLSVTFHRAFDAVSTGVHQGSTRGIGVRAAGNAAASATAFASLDTLIDLGIDRVLTSGTPWQSNLTALDGVEMLSALLQHAAGRIEIVVGGGVTRDNVAEVVARLPKYFDRLSFHAYSDLVRDDATEADRVAEFRSQIYRTMRKHRETT